MKSSQILTILLFICSAFVSAQNEMNLHGVLIKDISTVEGEKLKKGKEILITGSSIRKTDIGAPGNSKYINKLFYLVENESKYLTINSEDVHKISIDQPQNIKDAWDFYSLQFDIVSSLLDQGLQYDIRMEMDEECHQFLDQLEEGNYILHDDYLEGYIQSLALKIHSSTLDFGRPGNIAVKVLKSNDINAFCLPNGTILITTELLSTINSEDELIGALAHEIAHFALDHQLRNYNAQLVRKQRAEFWAIVATSIAAAGEVYLAEKHEIYSLGELTAAVAVLSESIANLVIDRMGANYSIEQEEQADMIAGGILVALGKSKSAFCSLLNRMKDACIQQGKYEALFDSKTHPKFSDRIVNFGNCQLDEYYDETYLRKVSLANNYSAIIAFNLLHYVRSNELVDKNITANVATESDYIIKAKVLFALYDTPEKMKEALGYLNKSKALNVYPYNTLYKEEGLILLRLNRNDEAKQAFNTYLINLEKMKSENSNFLEEEIKWTKEMIYKTPKL